MAKRWGGGGGVRYMANILCSCSQRLDGVQACSPRPKGTAHTQGRCHIDKKFSVRTVKH